MCCDTACCDMPIVRAMLDWLTQNVAVYCLACEQHLASTTMAVGNRAKRVSTTALPGRIATGPAACSSPWPFGASLIGSGVSLLFFIFFYIDPAPAVADRALACSGFDVAAVFIVSDGDFNLALAGCLAVFALVDFFPDAGESAYSDNGSHVPPTRPRARSMGSRMHLARVPASPVLTGVRPSCSTRPCMSLVRMTHASPPTP